MANWALYFASGIGFKAKLPSAFIDATDVYLTKVPNFVDGSEHTASAPVILNGEMRIDGLLRVDDLFTASVGSTSVFNGSFTVNTLASFTKGITVTQATTNTNAITATANGTGSGINATGGTTGPGVIANPGTAQTNTAPTCAAKFAGYIQLTGTDPNATVDPGANNVLHAKMIPKAAVLIDSSYAVLDSYNVASVTNIAANEYRVTFVRAMANVNYGIKFNVHGAPAYHGAHNGTKATTHFNFNIFKTDTLALGFGSATEAYIEVTGSQS